MPLIDQADSLWDLLEQRRAQSGAARLLMEGTDTVLTTDEFADRAERVAAGFAAMGIGEGTPVVWQLTTSVDAIVASMALSRLGAIQTPVIHLYREKEMGFCINQAQPRAVIVPGSFGGHDYVAMVQGLIEAGTFAGDAPEIVALDQGLPEGDPSALAPAPGASAGDDAPVRWVYYTSGTTSDPKGVRHTDQTLMAAGIGLAHALEVDENDVGSMVFPYAHIAGPDYLIMMLSAGMPAALLASFTLDGALALYRHWECTMAGGSTVFYTMFLTEQRKDPDTPLIPSLRLLSGGGAPKPPEIYYEVVEEMKVPVAHGYGMTECPMIAQGGPSDTPDQLANSDGAPVRGCEITIVKADGSVAAAGEVGEVRLAGPMVFKGYTDKSLNGDAFDSEGRFRSGDLGLLREDGHISLTGRLKDVIIRKGENVSATEVEEALYSHPKIGAVAVVGLPDRERGERVCAVVEPPEAGEALTLEEMVTHCVEAGLMKQKIPEQLEVVERLPRNDTLQKVLKYKLRETLADKPWPA